ncbi:hypothetical protein [Streptomyces caniscabiei]|nr:hypothetical protein [Streptomyces caniscabiei]
MREAALFFGWARLGADVWDALTGDIDTVIAAGDLIESVRRPDARRTG